MPNGMAVLHLQRNIPRHKLSTSLHSLDYLNLDFGLNFVYALSIYHKTVHPQMEETLLFCDLLLRLSSFLLIPLVPVWEFHRRQKYLLILPNNNFCSRRLRITACAYVLLPLPYYGSNQERYQRAKQKTQQESFRKLKVAFDYLRDNRDASAFFNDDCVLLQELSWIHESYAQFLLREKDTRNLFLYE